MVAYIVRRLLSGLALLFALTLVTFAIYRLIPNNPGCVVLPCGLGATTTHAQLEAAAHRIGADRPVTTQYAKFVWRILRHGSFGPSWRGVSIDKSIRASLPPTVSVLAGGFVVLLLLAIPLAMLSALHAQRTIDRAVLAFSLFGIALHPFVLGVLLEHAFVYHLHLFPAGRYCHLAHLPPVPVPPNTLPQYAPEQPCGGPVSWAHHMVLPWLTFAIFFLPLYTRMIRTRMLETLDDQHVVTARAKGASEVRVLLSHVLRPALLPLVTMIGLDLGAALTAVIYIDTIYGLGGFGSLAVAALASATGTYDLPLIAAIFFVIAVAIVVLNLLVDLCYAWLDPRVRLVGPAA
ncbi:MAG TPA: ABC transporter permease [Gaiellaceae bacterium]|jgi:peptide/nickel transport system permease protein|nr:ABC transporter permease [Gaiellaceae bacterium]